MLRKYRLSSDVVHAVDVARRVSVGAEICWTPILGGAITAVLEVTTGQVAISPAVSITASRTQRAAVTARDTAKVWAKPAAYLAAASVMWLIVIAMITIV